MGDDVMGQTFLLQSGGNLYESQLSYFKAIDGLDLTPGHQPAAPRDLQHAFGAMQSTETAQQCFGCHTTASSVHGRLDESKATPGVTCEACHGPAATHVKAMQANRIDEGRAAVVDPREFGPVKTLDYCGACHRAPLDVTEAKDLLPIDVRFQPYRLSKSRCWSRPDARITCTACHNPHEPLVQDLPAYDAKCEACHGAAPPAAERKSAALSEVPARCPVSTRNCVSCHMPRYRVPQLHGSFTDHDIRVVLPGDPFPL
jgi:hypothetical protein